MKSSMTNLLLVLAGLLGLSLLLYPSVSNYWNELHQTQAISQYMEVLENVDAAQYEEMLMATTDYNKTLVGDTARYYMTDEQRAVYNSLLDATGTGVMGYIEISVINCTIPIYHGTTDSVLSAGVGHLEGSSLPVGGESTHCVLSGHRGLPSAKLFTDLDKLEVGNTFCIRTLNELLTYQVDQILIVLPSETDALEITAGEDYCTLVTCTPYGINTHRLLVRGTRVENTEAVKSLYIPAEAFQIDSLLIAPLVAVPPLLVLLVLLLVSGRKKKKPYGKMR